MTSIESAKIDSLFERLFKPDEPGAMVVIAKDNKIAYSRGFGKADLETNSPIGIETSFNICSVSKQFAAVALLKLEEEKRLSLDDCITKYFPNLHQPFYKNIRLKHLLSHTSGIPDTRPRTEKEWTEYLKKHESKFSTLHEYKLFCEEEESLRYLESLEEPRFLPGSCYEYVNTTYQMVVPIIEQTTGENFDKWMTDNIFIPVGMKNTLFYNPTTKIDNMSHGYIPAQGDNPYGFYRSKDGKWEESDYGEVYFFGTKADGGIYTTASDFLKWNEALINGSIIKHQTLKKAHTGWINSDIPYTKYGYGWYIENKPGRPEKIYHTGDNGGYYIFEGGFPSESLFYLIFANRPDWDREKTVEEMDYILGIIK